MLDKNEKEQILIEVRDDGMEAYARVLPGKKENISVEDMLNVLAENNICYGIMREEIEQLCGPISYDKELLVAHGKSPVQGKDGYFEYFFDRMVTNKPVVLEDGSVDYHAMNKVVTVSEGQVVVKYHTETTGEDGVDVYGHSVHAIPGKKLASLKGKGFHFSEDHTEYIASVTGKIECDDQHLNISNLLVIDKDMNYLEGDIDFKGDLMIEGDVDQGKTIKATGNITIRGHVESATIIAGRDITFVSGMQGAQKGLVVAGGNIRGKFFEQVEIKAEGSVTANAIMNSKVQAGKDIIVTGQKGTIIGGELSAVSSIRASIIGNANEIYTRLTVGTTPETYVELKDMTEKIKKSNERVAQIEAAMEMIAERGTRGHNNPFVAQNIQLVRTKVSITAEIHELEVEREKMIRRITDAQKACIIIDKRAYPKTVMMINGTSLFLKEEKEHTAFYLGEKEIETRNM